MSGWAWRPSLFEPSVSHLTQEGDEPKRSERFGDALWVHGACGQNTSADRDEAWWMTRCVECVTWLRRALEQEG